MVWAAAALGLDPPEAWRAAWLQRSRDLMQQQRQQRQRVTAQGMSSSLWAGQSWDGELSC